MYSERDFLPCILFISLFIVYTIKAENSEPKLILDGRVNIPVSILKKGLEGTVELQVYIDREGQVESCEIIRGKAPELDSIARHSLLRSKFSPAIENGIPVPSIINIQEAFIADSLIGTFNQVEPVIEGKVLSRKDGLPVNEAQIKVVYLDTTGDPSVSSFSTYCRLISKIPGQKYGHKAFITFTDSAGSFCFRLLPSGPVQFTVTATGYQTVKDTILINENSKINMNVSMPGHLIDTSQYEITVYGKDVPDNSTVSLSTQQYRFGMTHSLSNIIQNLTPVRRSSKSESAILVRSGTPYDNLYLIFGVPFYAPYNFAGFAYGEHDGVMLSALTDIKVTIDEIAGRYPSVSGALIEANPGIVRPANQRLIPRPELVIDLGNRSADLLFSLEARKKSKRILQLGFTGANFHLLKWMQIHYGINKEAALGPGLPFNFGSLTLTGQYEFKNLLYETFGWFAWDGYSSYLTINEDTGLKWFWKRPIDLGSDNFFPWGMVGIGLRPSYNEKWRFFAGGSHQYFSEGKRFGPVSRRKISFLNNVNTAIIFNPISKKLINVDFEGRYEHKQWYGDVVQSDSSGFERLACQEGEEDAFSLHSNLRLI
jgi:TonB family protein